MSAEPIRITEITNITDTAEPLVNGRAALCRFCGRPARPGQHRAPGPFGPICTSCLRAGRLVCLDGEDRTLGGTRLATLVTAAGTECEFCGRSERRTLLGRHRPLPRMRCAGGDAVICADCVARGDQLLSHVLRVRGL